MSGIEEGNNLVRVSSESRLMVWVGKWVPPPPGPLVALTGTNAGRGSEHDGSIKSGVERVDIFVEEQRKRMNLYRIRLLATTILNISNDD